MTNRKSTKRALLTSVLALLLCMSMLVGTTFAWFTDSATTGVNTIQSGTLDVDIVNAEGESLNGQKMAFVDANGNTDILWEPGATFSLEEFTVVNKGNLALKYEVVINGLDGDAKLLEAITFSATVGGMNYPMAGLKGNLSPNESTLPIVISGYMDAAAGNEYQGLTLEGISLTVYATQYTEEYDSFSNQYDAGATIEYFPKADIATWSDEEIAALGNLTTVDDANVTYTPDAVYTFSTTETYDEAQQSAYRYWHADYVVTFDNDVAANSMGLTGSYDSYQNGAWVGFLVPEDIAAGEAIRLLDYAGISMNYEELCLLVKEFDCGVFNLESANNGTTMTVELRMYETEAKADSNGNSVNVETGRYTTINSVSYTLGMEMPEADVTENGEQTLYVESLLGGGLFNEEIALDATFTMVAPHTYNEALALPYGDWNADFVVTVSNDLAEGDLILAGQYDTNDDNWQAFYAPAMTAGEELRLLETADETMSYADICLLVKEFNCGVANVNAPEGTTITVELCLFETDASGNEIAEHVVGTYEYTF